MTFAVVGAEGSGVLVGVVLYGVWNDDFVGVLLFEAEFTSFVRSFRAILK